MRAAVSSYPSLSTPAIGSSRGTGCRPIYNSGTAVGSRTYNEYVLHRFVPEYRAHVYINELFGALGQINEYAAYHYLWRHVNKRDRLLGAAKMLAMTCATLIFTPLCILVAFSTKACL